MRNAFVFSRREESNPCPSSSVNTHTVRVEKREEPVTCSLSSSLPSDDKRVYVLCTCIRLLSSSRTGCDAQHSAHEWHTDLRREIYYGVRFSLSSFFQSLLPSLSKLQWLSLPLTLSFLSVTESQMRMFARGRKESWRKRIHTFVFSPAQHTVWEKERISMSSRFGNECHCFQYSYLCVCVFLCLFIWCPQMPCVSLIVNLKFPFPLSYLPVRVYRISSCVSDTHTQRW